MVRSDFNIRVALARRESEINCDLLVLTDWWFIVGFSKRLASMMHAELPTQMFYFLSDVESQSHIDTACWFHSCLGHNNVVPMDQGNVVRFCTLENVE